MSASQLATLSQHLNSEGADDLPLALRQSLARHRDNLASMVVALRAAGLDEASVESHLSTLIDSYRVELAAALRHLGCEA